MVVVFVLLKIDVTLGGPCGIWKYWHSFEKVKCFQSCSKVFVFGVTQENENAGSMQDLILLFWCKSRELRDRESPRCLCVVIPVVESFSSDFLRAVCNTLLGRVALRVLSNIKIGDLPRELSTTSTRWLFSQKRSHRRCLTGPKIRLRLEVL